MQTRTYSIFHIPYSTFYLPYSPQTYAPHRQPLHSLYEIPRDRDTASEAVCVFSPCAKSAFCRTAGLWNFHSSKINHEMRTMFSFLFKQRKSRKQHLRYLYKRHKQYDSPCRWKRHWFWKREAKRKLWGKIFYSWGAHSCSHGCPFLKNPHQWTYISH